jgi:CCR4-NOT transcriptional regulation complex NOT5 subunit
MSVTAFNPNLSNLLVNPELIGLLPTPTPTPILDTVAVVTNANVNTKLDLFKLAVPSSSSSSSSSTSTSTSNTKLLHPKKASISLDELKKITKPDTHTTAFVRKEITPEQQAAIDARRKLAYNDFVKSRTLQSNNLDSDNNHQNPNVDSDAWQKQKK